MGKKLTTEEFVNRATQIHSGRYNYNLVEYKGTDVKVKILCEEHGVYEQVPHAHLNGSGCRKCYDVQHSKRLLKGSDWFLKRANEVHGGKYTYSLDNYSGVKCQVTIMCHLHGVFTQQGSTHLSGAGCPACHNKARKVLKKDTETFVKEFYSLFPLSDYKFGRSEYKGSHSDIIVECAKHGEFESTPSRLLRGHGCPQCGLESNAENLRLTNEEFVSRVSPRHNNRYTYEKADYKGSLIKVEVTCPVHGSFWVRAESHMAGGGCPSCADYGFNVSKPAYIYVVQFGEHTGYGITRDIKTRFQHHRKWIGLAGLIIDEAFASIEIPGHLAKEIENQIIANFPIDPRTEHIKGFKRESTTASFSEVQEFIEQKLKENGIGSS